MTLAATPFRDRRREAQQLRAYLLPRRAVPFARWPNVAPWTIAGTAPGRIQSTAI